MARFASARVVMRATSGSETLILVFSRDRALQCDAALRSLFHHCADVSGCSVVVLSAVSSDLHARTYDRLADEWRQVRFHRQTDFREDVLRVLASFAFVLFVVDDTVVVHPFEVAPLRAALDAETRALGVSLRLGREMAYCYSLARAQRIPAFVPVGGELLRFRWAKADGDFGYPLEVSSSLYRGEDIRAILNRSSFRDPTSLEDRLAEARISVADSRPFLFCPVIPCAFSNPVNIVQTSAANRAGSDPRYGTARLAASFEAGERIDTLAYAGFLPNACHQELPIVFRSLSEGDLQWTPAAEGATPRISVLMPARNASLHVRDAVQGILAQTMGDFELLVFDDGSIDSTRAIVAGIPDHRIRLAGTRVARGIVDALNACLAEARGRFIARADADDIAHPLRFERQIAYLEAHPGVGVCGTWMTSFGDGAPNLYAFPGTHEEIVADLLFNPSVVHPTVMFRADLAEAGDIRWRHGDTHAEDYAWLVRLSSFARFANIEESLYAYRMHAGQVGSANAAEQRVTTLRLQRELIARLVPDMSEREFALHELLTRWRIPAPLDSLDEIHAWLQRLACANDERGVYDRAACRAVLARRFFRICMYHAPHGLAAWSRFRCYALHRAAPVTPRERLSQFRRCLLRKDVPGRRSPDGDDA